MPATTLVGRQEIAKEYNRGYKFIADTYASSQDTYVPNSESALLERGIVIEGDFNRDTYGQGGVIRPPYSLNIKIIGNDFNTDDPILTPDKRWYRPLFPIHNVSIPEVGEEVLIIRESKDFSSHGYWIGRVNESPLTNLFLAESWKQSSTAVGAPNNFSSMSQYGFNFNVKELRDNILVASGSPSYNVQNIAIAATYGDVIQQGRSRTYIRHSFNKNNYTGILEQGLNNDLNTTQDELGYQPLSGANPSIGETRTKTLHFYDTTIKKVGDFNFASFSDEQTSGNYNGLPRSMIFNEADQIYNVAGGNNGYDTTLYSQVLGEKLNNFHRQNIILLRAMLDGVTGLTTTVQTLLDAFMEHEHALPKIELNLEKTIRTKDLYRTSPKIKKNPPKIIRTPSKRVRIRTGTKMIKDPLFGYERSQPIYSYTNVPGSTISVPSPPTITPGRMRARRVTQKINFEAIIGGEENPRFTAPIQTDTDTAVSSPLVVATADEQLWGGNQGQPLLPAPQQNIEKTELGMKTSKVSNDTEELIESFNIQKENLNMIFTKVTDYLSENQFVN